MDSTESEGGVVDEGAADAVGSLFSERPTSHYPLEQLPVAPPSEDVATPVGRRRRFTVAAVALGLVVAGVAGGMMASANQGREVEQEVGFAEKADDALDDITLDARSEEPTPTATPTPEQVRLPRMVGRDIDEVLADLDTLGVTVVVRSINDGDTTDEVLDASHDQGDIITPSMGSLELTVAAPIAEPDPTEVEIVEAEPGPARQSQAAPPPAPVRAPPAPSFGGASLSSVWGYPALQEYDVCMTFQAISYGEATDASIAALYDKGLHIASATGFPADAVRIGDTHEFNYGSGPYPSPTRGYYAGFVCGWASYEDAAADEAWVMSESGHDVNARGEILIAW